MKRILLMLLMTLFVLYSYGITRTITNVGFTFSPDTIIINSGDEITFSLASFHDAIEVSQATWNMNGISPIIGFTVPLGGGNVPSSLLPVGVHYYVCGIHASAGMKGIITVLPFSGITDYKVQDDILIYPNPVKENINVQANPLSVKVIEIKLYNFQGKLMNVLLSKTEISGYYHRSFPLSKNTAPGIYFVQVLSNNTNTYQKVVIQ